MAKELRILAQGYGDSISLHASGQARINLFQMSNFGQFFAGVYSVSYKVDVFERYVRNAYVAVVVLLQSPRVLQGWNPCDLSANLS